MATVVVFPGQGAQAPGLGRPWSSHPAWARAIEVDAAAGRPLSRLLTEADDGELARTANAQLAMFVHGLVVWEAVRPQLGETPVAFAGHSLGQLTALVAAGTLSLDDGVALAVERADATQAAADAEPGAMAAFLGLDLDAVVDIADDAGCWMANHNAPGQAAVAGTPAAVERAMDGARRADAKKVVRLDVAGAFHTPMMRPAAEALRPTLGTLAFADVTTPVVANHDGRAHTDGSGWADRLERHLVEPVRWHDCSVTLGELGATRVVEVGASRLLWPMVKRSVRGIDTAGVGEPADLDQLGAVAA